MLVDLNKEEINYIVNVLSLNNSEIMNKEETQFSSNLYLKLRNLSTVCTCKEVNP
jgi:DNA-directed RNA polymerase